MHLRTLPQTKGVAATTPWIDHAAPAPRATAAPPTATAPNAAPGDVRIQAAAGAAAHPTAVRPPGTRSAEASGAAATPAVGPDTAAASRPTPAAMPANELVLFMARARELLDAADEAERRRLENEVLDLSIPLQAAGIFDILGIAHPALAAMVSDYLAESAPAQVAARAPDGADSAD